MIRIEKKFRIMFASALVCFLFISACGGEGKDPSALLQTGSDQYGDGKKETVYELPGNSAETLAELIDDYSARRGMPEPIEEEKAREIAELTEEEDRLDTTGNDRLGSDEDLEKMLSWMLDETKSTAKYSTVNGYVINPEGYKKAIERAARKDPIDGICVASYGMYMAGATGTLVLEYDLPAAELVKVKEETRDLAKKALDELDLKGKQELDIIRAVNDYLCDNNEYPDADRQRYPGNLEGYSPLSHTAYGLFKEHAAVCEGYARACEILLAENGVECISIWGETSGGGHAWNMVKTDGAWYHLDICWNDESTSRMDFFLLSDDDMLKSRIWDPSEYPASAGRSYQP